MDKKIKQIESKTKSLIKDEKELLKQDHKRDSVCKLGEKVKKMKGKK